MIDKETIRAEAGRLLAGFRAAGAQVVEADILQPAGTLLDLYGEDIRARAFTTSDPVVGEMMLRPDFTVPVVQMHMAGGAEPARYAYAGEVFRRQEERPERPREYMQVGFEVFDRENPAAADAEVFALFSQAVAPLSLRAMTGDIGILMAAVEGLDTSAARKAALRRHLWRPRRFKALLTRYGPKGAEMRAAVLGRAEAAAKADGDAPQIGLRSARDVAARIEALRADVAEPAIPGGVVELIDDMLGLRETAPNVLSALRDIAVDLPAIAPAVQAFAVRLDAMNARGIDVDALQFETSYGRASMEYYDGFVFGFHADSRPDLPPVATGGRYDALTSVLGQGRSIPAVGGVVRPGLMLELGGAGQ